MGDEPTTPKTITIPLEQFEELREAADRLDALYAAGVDNWEGYSEAVHGG